MKVSIVYGGTLVPVLVETEADTDALGPEDSDTLRRLAAAVPSLEPSAPEPPQPDRGCYRVCVDEDDGESEETTVSEAALSDELRALIDFVAAVPGATRTTRPLGSD